MTRIAVSFALALVGLGSGLTADGAWAQKAQKEEKSKSALSGFDNSNSKEPYKVDANTLEVKQAENKVTYAGDVVVIQGTMTMRCSSLVIFFNKNEGGDKKDAKADKSKAKAAPAASVSQGVGGANGLKRLECHGPVTINKEKQTATAQLLIYENDTVTLTGNVVMSDGENVQAGEKMVYNTKSTIGKMEGGRVRGIFTPGAGDKPGAKRT